MKVVELTQKSDVRDVIEEALGFADRLDGVIVLALDKDGAQLLRSSTMNAMQKAFLGAFFSAWLSRWFRLEDEP